MMYVCDTPPLSNICMYVFMGDGLVVRVYVCTYVCIYECISIIIYIRRYVCTVPINLIHLCILFGSWFARERM
jgi:hypothetical protein